MSASISTFTKRYYQWSDSLKYFSSISLLAARFYMAWVFFKSGLTKIQDWDTTLFLFEEEYSVPLLNYEVAAFLATAGELVLPVLLVLGLATRFSAVGLFVVNVVAVISLEEIAPAALYLHYLWGILLLQVMVWGSGLLAADTYLSRKLNSGLR